MVDAETCFERWVNRLPKTRWFKFVSSYLVLPFWARWSPVPKLPGGPRVASQPSENLQRMMNLVMPLKNTTAIGRAEATAAIAKHVDGIFAGLDNVGTVHFARFVLIGDYVCMISVYDGDFSNYIRDFIATIGDVFDDVIELVEGGKKMIPTAEHVEEFIDWVHEHDLFQMPDSPTDLFALQKAAFEEKGQEYKGGKLRLLSPDLILQLHANPNISLGGGYRAYPGFSVAQVRQSLGVGW